MNNDPKTIQFMGGWASEPSKDDLLLSNEPFFGPNARPFIIQLVVALLVMFTIGPVVGYAIADLGCQYLYLCSPEAEARLHGSAHRQ